jgi:hypothetical protein
LSVAGRCAQSAKCGPREHDPSDLAAVISKTKKNVLEIWVSEFLLVGETLDLRGV